MNAKGLRIGMVVIAASVAAGFFALTANSKAARTVSTEEIAATAVAALPAHQSGVSHSLALVYSQPDTESEVINVVPPASELKIIGLDQGASFFALAGENGSVSGWVSRGNVSVDLLTAQTDAPARVFDRADSAGAVVNFISPAKEVILLGTSADGQYYAVSTSLLTGRLDGYIAAQDLKVAKLDGQTANLTKVYHSTAAEDREIVTVLPPYHALSITGRTADGTWALVTGFKAGAVYGWVQMADLFTEGNVVSLPVFKK